MPATIRLTDPLSLTRARRELGREQLASLRTAALAVRAVRGAFILAESQCSTWDE